MPFSLSRRMSQITNYQKGSKAPLLVFCSGQFHPARDPRLLPGFFRDKPRGCAKQTNIRCDSDLHRNVTPFTFGGEQIIPRGPGADATPPANAAQERRESGTPSPPMPSHVRRTRTVSCRVKAAELLSATFGARLAQFGHWRGRGQIGTVRLTAYRGTIMHHQSRIRRDSFQPHNWPRSPRRSQELWAQWATFLQFLLLGPIRGIIGGRRFSAIRAPGKSFQVR